MPTIEATGAPNLLDLEQHISHTRPIDFACETKQRFMQATRT